MFSRFLTIILIITVIANLTIFAPIKANAVTNSFNYVSANGWWSTTGYDSNKITCRVVSGDFNGDGKSDIAALYDYGNGQTRIHVWLLNGSTFTYQSANGWWSTTGYDAGKITAVVAGDFNGDGKTDIAAFYDYGNGNTRLHVWLANASSSTGGESTDGLVYDLACTESGSHYGYLTNEQMDANARYIYNYMSTNNWSINAICAMLGNMQVESGVNLDS